MPRTSSLAPTFRKERANKGLAAWCVNIPAEISETGKRQQKFYTTQDDAKKDCAVLKIRRRNFGNSLGAMTPAKIAEASEAFKLLEPLNLGLLDAVRAHVSTVKSRSSSIKLGDAFDRFATSKEGKSQKYLQEIRHARASFSPLHDQLVCDIDPEDLESILAPLPPSSRNAKMRRLRSVFNLCVRRGWLSAGANPISKIDWADTGNKEVEVFPVSVIKKLFDHALANDLEFLPYRVFTFFCGIRPEGELERLDWSDVRIKKKTVVLRAEITKTKRKRFVDLSSNAIEWLDEYKARGGNMTGLVAPWSHQVRRSKHRKSCKDCGIKKWIQQGARHSYCSYWLAKHEDANKLVLQSGHTDANTMWTLYHQGVTKEEARAFWALRPPKTGRPRNVIRMAA